MTYIGLGPRSCKAAADLTGRNPGNLTNAFTAQVLGFSVNQYECYHMVVTSVPGGGSGTVYLNASQWGFSFPATGSEWDPSQPMLINSGMELDVFWNISATNPSSLPVVTAWFRYDPAVPGNR
jgi:hypothetical protein